MSQRTFDHTASICLISHAVPVLPRHLYGRVYSLHPGRRGLYFSIVFRLGGGTRVRRSRVAHAVVGDSHHFACRRTRTIVRAKRNRCGRRVLTLGNLTRGLHSHHFGSKTVTFSHCRIGFSVSRGNGPLKACVGRSGRTGGLVRRFVLLTGHAMTRFVKGDGGGAGGAFICHVRRRPSPRGLESFSTFVDHFNCGVHARKAGASVSGKVGGLLSDMRNGPRRGLIRALTVHSVRGTRCAASGVNRCKLTVSCCARFASPVHHCPSVVIRHLLRHCLTNNHDIVGGGCRRCYGRYSRVRVITSGTRHSSVGCGRIRFVGSGLKRIFSNIMSNIAR